MQDYDLTLLPQSRVRFRLGFSHDRDEGPGFFTTDSGTVPDFPEITATRPTPIAPAWISACFRAPRFPTTSSSATSSRTIRVLESPTATPQNYGYQLANGTPVDLGIAWSTQTPAEALPCAAPITNAATTPPTAKPNCNGFLSYSQVGRPRNSMPTERLRFQSNYFKNFEMTGSVGYSSSDNQIPDFDEILNGFVTRSATRVEHDRRPGARASAFP